MRGHSPITALIFHKKPLGTQNIAKSESDINVDTYTSSIVGTFHFVPEKKNFLKDNRVLTIICKSLAAALVKE